jgi:hypothetical protein
MRLTFLGPVGIKDGKGVPGTIHRIVQCQNPKPFLAVPKRESFAMYVSIIIALVCVVPIAWFWYGWFWRKPAMAKSMPARTWPPNRGKTAPKPRFIVPF